MLWYHTSRGLVAECWWFKGQKLAKTRLESVDGVGLVGPRRERMYVLGLEFVMIRAREGRSLLVIVTGC